ncbi:MAG: MFS transporter [Parachlamydiaceae bacterium]|nr:MFS transporter [Parachlamydiaceae bacterium]
MKVSRMMAWTIWMVASIFYAYQYILRVMPNIMLDDIMNQYQIDAAIFGQFSGFYYIGYSLLHLPIGIMLDRYGPKKVMSGCILLTVVGLMPLLFSDYWIYPIAGRFLIGVGSSAAILGVFKVVRMAFSEGRFARMLSFSVMIGLIGAIYGGAPVSYMSDVLGYQAVVKFLAFAGIGLAIITYLVIPDIKSKPQTAVFSDIKEVFGNYRVVLTCLFAGLMVGPLEGFADVWGTAFLKQSYGFDTALATSLPSMIYIGMCFGAPVLNFMAEKMGSYLGAIIAAGVGMTASFVCLLSWQLPYGTVSISFVIVGICCAYQILAIYQASVYVREEVAGLTTAVANMIIMIFGYAFHTAIGTVVNAMGGPNAPDAMNYGLTVIPIALGIGTIGFVSLMLSCKRDRALQVA